MAYRAGMRTFVDIPDDQIAQVDTIARKQGRSRAALIREAVADLVEKHGQASGDNGFGLWRGKSVALDGLAYQRRARAAW